jgi:hypothetical protein
MPAPRMLSMRALSCAFQPPESVYQVQPPCPSWSAAEAEHNGLRFRAGMFPTAGLCTTANRMVTGHATGEPPILDPTEQTAATAASCTGRENEPPRPKAAKPSGSRRSIWS